MLATRLAAEPDAVVGSLLCLTAGMMGEEALLPAVAGWRDQPGRITRWTVQMGLVRLTPVPDPDLLTDLCNCLFDGPDEVDGWPFHDGNPARAAAEALGDLPVGAAPGLADLLLHRLAAGGEDPDRFLYAASLLLSLVFPDGPRPAAALTAQQSAAARVIAQSGLAGHPAVQRLLREYNLPVDENANR